jgi:hypothetical protein
MMPICKKCKNKKSKYDFYRNMSKPKGIDSICISCKNEYYEASSEGMSEWKQEYKNMNTVNDPF